jgi:phage minor structural protein
MTQQIKLYDTNLNLLAILDNAFNVGYEQRLNEAHRAVFSIPNNDSKAALCVAYNYIKLWESDGTFIDTYRIMPTSISHNIDGQFKTFECEHVLNTLQDDILFQYHALSVYAYSAILSYILTAQTTVRWNVGTVDFSSAVTVKFENENLLSAVLATPSTIDANYQFTWDTSSSPPWNLNLTSPSTATSSYIRYSKNLIEITKEEDSRDIITKLYPLGYGEGINQLTIEDVSTGGDTFITASTTAYGTISGYFIDRRIESAQTLLESAQAKLSNLQTPKITYSVKAADLSSITGKTYDAFRLGEYVNIYDDEINININTRIVSISKRDIIDAPGDIDIELSNKVDDIIDINADLNKRTYVSETYSQGSTNIDSNDFQDNCDDGHPALIKFYIPDETILVNECTLTYETTNFRAYSLATGGGGTAVVTSAGGGTAVVTSAGGGTAVITSSQVGASQQTSQGYESPTAIWTMTTAFHTHFMANHSHTVDLPVHDHDVPLPSHDHEVTLPSHTHQIDYGIYEYSATATLSMTITVDTASITVTATAVSDYDIVPYLTKDGSGKVTRGWHTVEILPNDLARITATVVKKIYIQSRGNYTL